MSAPVEVRDRARALREQGKSYREIGERLGIGKSTAALWASAHERDHARERAETAERKARALAELVEPPLDDGTPGAFTRGYQRALDAGIDPLDLRDPVWECESCGRLPVDGCVCVPVREEKAA